MQLEYSKTIRLDYDSPIVTLEMHVQINYLSLDGKDLRSSSWLEGSEWGCQSCNDQQSICIALHAFIFTVMR